ncbi:hypothetical protein [Hwanghaeella sp.]|uniref:hypothetical protein n=1 Tax=Hwanghaeella sp. TaxID=2605943 RepID=UPI003CCBB1E9
MTASRADRRCAGNLSLAVWLSVGLGLTAPHAVLAQTTIIPAPTPAQTVEEEQLDLDAPGASAVPAPTASPSLGPLQLIPLGLPDPVETRNEPVEIRSGIAVQSLQRIDPESVGVLDAGAGGFPVDMWTGTPRRRIDVLMERLPTAPVSEVQMQITRRLLLSRAAIPLDGEAGPTTGANASPGLVVGGAQVAAAQSNDAVPGTEEDAKSSTSLLDLRLQSLLEMGLLEDLDALIQAAPSRTNDPDVQRMLLEARLLRNDLPGACALTAAPPSDDFFWLKASVFCKAVAGDAPGAEFGATLIREEGGPDDQPFLDILSHFVGSKPRTVKTLGKPDALETAMMRTAKLPWPDGAMEEAGPAAQRIIALSSENDPVERLQAAEDLVVAGRLPANDLTALYADIQFDSAMMSNALSSAEEIGGAMGRALLYQAALSQENTVARAELLRKAFDIAKLEGRTALLNRAFLPLISSIPPQRELWWLANNAARALYLAGEASEARNWAETLRSEALRDPVAEQDALRLWAIARLAGDRVLDRMGRDAMTRWHDLQHETAPDEAVRRVTLLYSLFEALGEPVPEAAWEELLLTAQPDFQRMPNASLTRAIAKSASGLRQGETVLLALVMLGDAGPALAAPQTMGAVVQSLAAVGLPRDARALALDAAFGAGF